MSADMSDFVEKTFPRGGKKVVLFKAKRSSGFNLFGNKQKYKTKKVKKGKEAKDGLLNGASSRGQKKVSESKGHFNAKYVDNLKPVILKDGMLVLGIVHQISDRLLTMSLPGGLKGAVALSNISEFYMKLISESTDEAEVPNLKDIFKVGDCMPARVISCSEQSKFAFKLTLDPKSINSNLFFNAIEEGLILVGNVKSKEDYGYVIDTGISRVSAFLHKSKVQDNTVLMIGQIVRCCVTECNSSPGSCNIQLSQLSNDLQFAVVSSKTTMPIHSFVPGFQFKVTVKAKLKNGLEVSYKNDSSSKGYIHKEHLPQIFPKLSAFPVDSQYTATLLYVTPLVNFLNFKIIPKEPHNWVHHYGDIVGGKVVEVNNIGVTLKIGEKPNVEKCFVPTHKLKDAHKILQQKAEIHSLYPIGIEVPQVRLCRPNLMENYFVGTTDRKSLENKYFSLTNLKCGDVVSCRITTFDAGQVKVEIGRSLRGVVAFRDMTDLPLSNPKSKFKEDQKVKARVLKIDQEKQIARLTMKPSLVKSENIILTSYDQAKRNECYMGSVICVNEGSLIVQFFNGVTGFIHKNATPFSKDKSLAPHYYLGQVVKCYVLSCSNEGKLCLSLKASNEYADRLKVGKMYNVSVLTVRRDGLIIDVDLGDNEHCKGRIPTQLISDHPTLAEAMQSIYTARETFKAYCVHVSKLGLDLPVFSVCKTLAEFYGSKTRKKLKALLTVGSILPFLFKYKNEKKRTVGFTHVLPGHENLVAIAKAGNLSENVPFEDLSFYKYQLVFGKVIEVNADSIQICTTLKACWDKLYQSSLALLNLYMNELRLLKEKKSKHLRVIKLGSEVEGPAKEVNNNGAVISLANDIRAFAYGNFTTGEMVKGKVVWIDCVTEQVHITTAADCVADININQDVLSSLDNLSLRARIVHINNEVVVAALKGRGDGKLVFLPRRRHFNDFYYKENYYVVGEITKIHVTIHKPGHNLLGIDRKIVLQQEKNIWKAHEERWSESKTPSESEIKEEEIAKKREQNSVHSDTQDVEMLKVAEGNETTRRKTNRKRKAEEEITITKELKKTNTRKDTDGLEDANETIEIKTEVESDQEMNGINESFEPTIARDDGDLDIKSEDESDNELFNRKDSERTNKEKIDISSSDPDSDDDDDDNSKNKSVGCLNVGFNWDVLDNMALLSGSALRKEEDLSSDDEEDEESKSDKKKRKRLTTSERREKARDEEQRLRYVEEQLMDPDREPQTADDFDRAVLSSPDSSALWLRYMAFHLQGIEIEKARAVARRALKSISFREEQEKLNVWTALLNLEIMYGTDECLKKTMDEALQCNEPYRIHLFMLNTHANSSKLQEMEKLGNFILKKYKQVEDIWHDVASVYYRIGKLESGRNVLQRAMASLEKSKHVDLISKFAQLENRHGSSERAQTLYETVLSSFPKRVDVWSCYVDMLVKSNNIDLARQVLERATSQRLPPKKMKILFKKFLAFEETHGSPENVEKVREAAVEYVQTVGAIAED